MNKVNVFFILLLFLAKHANSQPANSSSPVAPFTAIQVYDGIEVMLEHGDGYFICPDSVTRLSDLLISVENNVLKIRKIAGTKYAKTPSLKITYINISSIEGFSKASINTKNLIKADSVRVVLKSGATMYASFDIKYLFADIIEGCLFKAEGYANIQEVEVATKATFSAFALEGIEAKIKASTGGTAKINIEKKLSANATTGGFINFKGNPLVLEKATLGGKINRDTD